DKELYSPKSIYNCYCVIVCYLKDSSLMHPRPNLFDETCYSKLIKSLDGKIKKTQDLNLRFADKSDSLSFKEVRHILNHDELHDNSPQALTKRVYFWLCLLCRFHGGRKCEILPDQDSKFTLVTDILYYINKHSSGFITQEFFLRIACKK
ncbi:29770_t:CDS:2, partial [Racocetra persica]